MARNARYTDSQQYNTVLYNYETKQHVILSPKKGEITGKESTYEKISAAYMDAPEEEFY